MSFDAHDHWRGLLALDAIARLDPAERDALDAHLATCPQCAADAGQLAAAAAALAFADPDRVTASDGRAAEVDDEVARLRPPVFEPGPPEREPDVAAGPPAASRRRGRGVRRAGVAALTMAAAAVVAVVVASALTSSSPPAPGGGRTLALHGPAGVVADARLRSEPWGTAIVIDVRGQPGGTVLSVSMGTAGGDWWPAGSYRSSPGDDHVTLACAVPARRIEGVRISDPSGRVVLASSAGWTG